MLRSKLRLAGCRYSSTHSYSNVPISFISADEFQKSLTSNRTLQRLRTLYLNQTFQVHDEDFEDTAHINSQRSLPMTKLPKKEIFTNVMNDANIAPWRKHIVKWFRIGIFMMKYYKNGIKNTYLVSKETKLFSSKYERDSKTSLITQMCKIIEFNEIQYRVKKDSSKIKSLPLTRKEFVEYHRRKQVWKIPTFFLLALIFEEFTAVICYVFPKVAPHNCLTPGGFLKISRTHTNGIAMTGPFKYRSPYTLPKDDLYKALEKSAVIEVPSWKLSVYKQLEDRKISSETLMQIHQYLFIDDWLLLQHILNDPITNMSYKELVNCIWERQLYSKEEDLNKMVHDEVGRNILIWRLFIYWSFRFEGTISAGGDKLFSEKWGVNNVSILNYRGHDGHKFVGAKDLSVLQG